MFTPKEIRETEFERIVRGYNPEDVDGFLAQIADQIEKLTAEKEAAEKKARDASERMDSYREDGDALRSVLVTAEKMKAQMLAEAQETSEKLLSEAAERSEKLVADAQGQSDSIIGEIASRVAIEEATLKTLKKQVSDFKNNVLNIYKKHLETLSELPEEDELEVEAEEETLSYSAPETETAKTPYKAPRPDADTSAGNATSEFAFPEFDVSRPTEATEEPQGAVSVETDAFSFSAEEDDKNNRFGKLDFGDSFTFGAE